MKTNNLKKYQLKKLIKEILTAYKNNDSMYSDFDEGHQEMALQRIVKIVGDDLSNPIPKSLISQVGIRIDPRDYVLKDNFYHPTKEYLKRKRDSGYKGKISGLN